MKMIYLSHPYTGSEEENRAKARRIAARLTKEYPDTLFMNPLDAMQHTVAAGLGYEETLAQCVELLRRCNSVILLDGWRESVGCRKEYRTARDIGMRIYDGIEEFRQGMGLEAGKERHNGKCP